MLVSVFTSGVALGGSVRLFSGTDSSAARASEGKGGCLCSQTAPEIRGALWCAAIPTAVLVHSSHVWSQGRTRVVRWLAVLLALISGRDFRFADAGASPPHPHRASV